MKKFFAALTTLFLFMSSTSVFAMPAPVAVPEIDAAGSGIAMALLAGVITFMHERRNKRK